MKFQIPGKIPITITPAFLLFAALIGYLNSGTIAGTAIWIGIIFVSVIFHEFGHAITARLFGKKPRIELVALGGITYHEGEKLPFWKQFFIVFDGPLFGFFLFLIAQGIIKFIGVPDGAVKEILWLTARVNLFWTILNLVPVMPLDGGQLCRIIMEAIFGVKGFRYALIASIVVAVLISLAFFLLQSFLVGALFFLLAFQSYETWRFTRSMSEPDRREDLKVEMEKGETDLQDGKKQEALAAFEDVRAKAKKGMLYNSATQYAAFLQYDLGNSKAAYDLLKEIRSELGMEGIALLHRAAFDQKDYPLVLELAGESYQIAPSFETALRNAYACGFLSRVQPAIGWLETAQKDGVENLKEIIGETFFDPIRNDERFQDFLKSLGES